ncbi:MAG: hypothetical protein HOJ03_04585 [Nitrospina sp.]|jgi:hypothetical protein|nr:hypothetical protein [Nitrospina sp.]MBT5651754.1 hypothetical protein [Nitrospina sp.]
MLALTLPIPKNFHRVYGGWMKIADKGYVNIAISVGCRGQELFQPSKMFAGQRKLLLIGPTPSREWILYEKGYADISAGMGANSPLSGFAESCGGSA